jgi:hypothetical protein
MAGLAIVCDNGFNLNGLGELSGNGSTDITTFVPLKLPGKTNPAGALVKKSSPGNGGAGIDPE